MQKLKRKGLVDLGVDVRITLKRILRTRILSGLNWLSI
jgi:hypothetical protein